MPGTSLGQLAEEVDRNLGDEHVRAGLQRSMVWASSADGGPPCGKLVSRG